MSISTNKAVRRPHARPMAVARRGVQSGVMLLEALIGIVIFSIGILALVAMQTAAVNAVADAQYRVEAVNQANQLLSQIWTGVDRSSAVNLQASLQTFAHQTAGARASCNFAGAAGNTAVTDWASHLNSGGPGGRPLLPGSNASMQQIDVSIGENNRVIITICWRAPNLPAAAPANRHTLVAYVN